MKRSRSKWAALGWAGVKLAVCGALIAAVAVAIAMFGADADITESHADVVWLTDTDRSNTERFVDGLDNLGHSPAERYDLNGNTVYFSTAVSRKRPRQLMAEYQEEFQRQGLNDRIYVDLSSANEIERTETALTGGVVPLAISSNHVALAGTVTKNGAEDRSELLANRADAEDATKLFRAHRYIEISRSDDSRHTSVVATWSDEDFDYQRMVPGSSAEGQSFDATVPACPNCTRLTRFSDANPGRAPRTELSFIGPRSIDETRAYYSRTLADRGWQREDLTSPIDEIRQSFQLELPDGRTDMYRRGDESLQLSFLVDDRTGHTITSASRVD